MTQEDREQQIRKTGADIVNSFKNEHGELFIIFTHKHMKGYFITGDETGWEWYRLDNKGRFAYTEFVFSKKETETIQRVLELAKKL